jgi:SAM-dependent methyltransferase
VEGLVEAGDAQAAALTHHACRLCESPLRTTFADLGMSPLANTYPRARDIGRGETVYPLHAYVCDECLLVQLPVFARPEEIFTDYAYFSSYSDSWVDHARRYVEEMVRRFPLGPASRVLEVASNDGYLLQFFQARGVPVLGIEPARNVAEVARERGIDTLAAFFDAGLARELVEEGRDADLVVGNNVLAHVPDVHDFVEGLRIVLRPHGLVTMEFPHLLRLMQKREFDTIYHEHFSYFSLLAVERLFAAHALRLVDVEELPTHGGSIRVFARRREDVSDGPSTRVERLRTEELRAGLGDLDTYAAFDEACRAAKRDLLDFLIQAKRQRRSIVAYGAAAKGTTLLNYCGVGRDFVDYVVDRSPHKQGRLLPGTTLPIHAPERVAETRPDYLLLLAWNLREEITAQMRSVRDFGCRFVLPIPHVEVLD